MSVSQQTTGGSAAGRPKADNRVVRACDNCYKSKNKCLLSPDSQICENCKFFGLECTFLREKKKRGPPKGYIDAIENRIGRIETILYSLVEQTKATAGPIATTGILNDIAQDVKQLQTMASGSEIEDSPPTPTEFSRGNVLFQGFPPTPGQQNFTVPPPPGHLAQQSVDGRPTPPIAGRRYTDSGATGDPRLQSLPPSFPRPAFQSEQVTAPREHQRRRLHPPVQSFQSTTSDVDVEDDTAIAEDTEIIQMAGQLSLDENKTVRYHGSSSGLTLLTQSKRFDGTFWNLPNPGFWPASDRRTVKTEVEIDSKTQLPPISTQDRLLELYWEHIHPYVPLFYKDHFLKQLARDRQNRLTPSVQIADSIDQYERRIPYVLLFMMFALAARYEVPDAAVEAEALAKVWTAGDEYLMQARELLYLYNSSTISCCHALVLMAYHGVGTGLAGTWAYSGYGVRMAQDLGLHRDPAGWMNAFPVLKFSREEVEVRRRTWWAVYIVDKYISAWQGRPTTILNQEFDTQFPEDTVPPSSSSPNFVPTSSEASFACFNRSAMLTAIQAEIVLSFYSVKPTRNKRELMRLERLLLDWEFNLPAELQIVPGSMTLPAKNVILLHAQLENCRLLLHRPFVTSSRRISREQTPPSMSTGSTNESHVACTAAANAISHLVNLFKQHGWRRASPLFIYYVFSAAITHIYDATTHPSLAQTATKNLQTCLSALKHMGVAWPSASRSYLMIGDAPRLAENLGLQESVFADLGGDQFSFGESRGTKRQSEGDGNGGGLGGTMFGDEAYDALFWNQIANSTELPWSVVYPDDPQDHSFL